MRSEGGVAFVMDGADDVTHHAHPSRVAHSRPEKTEHVDRKLKQADQRQMLGI